jgi:hypothetical protein
MIRRRYVSFIAASFITLWTLVAWCPGVAWYKITYQIVPRRSEDYFSPAALVGEGIR